MNRKTMRIILISLLAAIFAVSVGMVIYNQIQYQKAIADADEAAQLAGLHTSRQPETRPPATSPPVETGAPASAPPTETAVPTEEPPPVETMPSEWYLLPEEARDLVGLDLGALRAVNKDVAGWISIPGTIVSYPLIQGANNQYYLRRNWKKQSITSGSIFMDAECSRDLTDFHTIIYGHRMRNETMFGTLKYYSRKSYWQAHPSVYIVLEDAIYRYDIFAAHEVAVTSIIYRLDLETNHLEEEFLQYCTGHSSLKTGLIPGAGDRILTLSTCTSTSSDTSRWVVHGVLAEVYDRTINQ